MTRNAGDALLDEDGLGNSEFNSRHGDLKGYDFAHKIDSVYQLRRPIPLKEMKDRGEDASQNSYSGEALP
jgi:hypothetical protein